MATYRYSKNRKKKKAHIGQQLDEKRDKWMKQTTFKQKTMKNQKATCSEIYDQILAQIVLEHEVQPLTSQLCPEEKTSPSSLQVAHALDHHLQQ
jgi:hypothetical protein